MAKKIVVLTGSPRKNGNSNAMAAAFVEAATGLGHTVVRFDAAELRIGGRRACETCYRTGKACTFDDDFNTIAPKIEEADAVVFASPVYWWGFTAQLKAVVDKLYSLYRAKEDFSGKTCALIACAADDDATVFDGMNFAYDRTVELLGWRTVGRVAISNVAGAGDIRHTDGASRAAALAGKF